MNLDRQVVTVGPCSLPSGWELIEISAIERHGFGKRRIRASGPTQYSEQTGEEKSLHGGYFK
jgi:hypothetical protein